LKQQGIILPMELVEKKIADHRHSVDSFVALLGDRREMLKADAGLRIAFEQEMKRFLPSNIVMETVENKPFWVFLTNLVMAECDLVIGYLSGKLYTPLFKM
jgi:hypothetical protein